MRHGSTTLAFVAVLVAPAVANAIDIVSLIGDKDGFNVGIEADEPFNPGLLPGYDGPGDGDGTDKWAYGSRSLVHVYSLPNSPIVSGRLEVFTGGQGFDLSGGGVTYVYLNGTYIGALTDGDVGYGSDNNIARRDVFDLTPHVARLSGFDTLYFQSPYSGDGWVIDYSELTVTTAATPGELLAQLREAVTGIGPGASLANKVSQAEAYYAVPDLTATCEMLGSFENEVAAQSGKKIDALLAVGLVEDAQAIMTAIGCE